MATFRLNIYENGVVAKTYECESYDVMFGTFEDLLALAEASETEQATKIMDLARPLLHDMFPGVTSEELRKTKMREVFALLAEAIQYAAVQMDDGASGKKKPGNSRRRG